MTAPGCERDGGFTLIELTITLAVSALVMTSILGILVSQSNAEKRMSSFADNQELLRQTIIAIQRDARSSEPLKQLGTIQAYKTRIDLNVYDSIDAAQATPIRWVVDETKRELRREVVDANGVPIEVTHRLAGVTNTAANPLFAFYKANDNFTGLGYYDLDNDQPKDVAECTVRIRIALEAAPRPGPSPAKLHSDAQLRNRLPGGVGCPQFQLTTSTTTP